MPKKEPLSVYLPRLILTVSMLVSFGALAGALGYLITHPELINISAINAPVKNNEAGSAVMGKDFLITLDANPSTGYTWNADFDKNYLMLRSKDFVPDKAAPGMVGVGGKEVFTFTPLKAGGTKIAMNYGRPWENKPIETKVFKYNIVENQEVTIATDKTEYEQGEIIKIVVNNGLNKSILYSGNGGRFWDIEYFKDNKWTNTAYEEGGNFFQLTKKNIGSVCDIIFYERSFPNELISQSNITTQFNQKICPLDVTGKPKIVRNIESGKYRLVFSYGFEISGTDSFKILEPETIFSNEFTIKDKTAQDQDASVVLNKTEFQKGETINGLINFTKDIYINPDFKIYQFNNNDWEYLGEWSFDGIQYTCCGVMPNCEANLVKNSPLKFTWDQKIVKEKSPILESMTKVQAYSGKYRVRVVYGDQSVCMDSIDTEFIIK